MSAGTRFDLDGVYDPADIWPHGAVNLNNVVESSDALVYQHESGIVAVWHGGEYIELCHWTGRGEVARLDYPHHVLNVWDSAAGEASIPFTMDALVAAVAEELDQ